MRRKLIAATALSVLFVSLQSNAQTGFGAGSPGSENAGTPTARTPQVQSLFPLPVLIFDITGSTLIGPVHSNVVVYANGIANAYRVAPPQFVLQQENPDDPPLARDMVIQRSVPLEMVQALQRELRQAGAGQARSQTDVTVADLPLTTVTFFPVSRPNAFAHTFSYYFPDGPVAGVARVIDDFINRVFPELTF